MTLKDIFRDLSYGELQGLAIGNLIPDDNESEPDPKSYKQIMSHINRALTKIYSRFLLSSKETYIEQSEAIAEYILDARYAQSNLDSPILLADRYIADSSAYPFKDDVLKIEQCYDEVGNILFLNDPTEDMSLYTPSFRSLQMPYPNEFNVIAVQYRASHPRLVYTPDQDADEILVAVPESLYEALLYYVAYRASPQPIGGVDGAQTFLQLYEQACQAVEKQGLYIQAETANWRFDAKGWV
jgi:hypothetical protein